MKEPPDSSFADQTGSFFDELGNILEDQKRQQEEGMGKEDPTPYSSMLTQDEEPTSDNPMASEEAEPEVITRNG